MSKFKAYIWLPALGSLLSLIALAISIVVLSPNSLSHIILIYAEIAVFAFCLFLIVGVFVRRLMGQREMLNQYIRAALRQGTWFTLILISSLVLSSYKLFSFLNAAFLVLAFVFLEFYLATRI